MKLYPAIILVLASAPAQAAPDELLDWHWAPTLCIALGLVGAFIYVSYVVLSESLRFLRRRLR